MKQVFAGLILFCTIGATAQTSNIVYHNQQKKLTAEKMREVILADEREHEAKAQVVLTGNTFSKQYNSPSHGYQVININYVKQHHNALLEGLGTGLSIAKQFTRYSNTPNTSYSDLHNYYRVPQQPTKR
jgi:hypothetical protein